jgi:CheY-like chemotaxis protein
VPALRGHERAARPILINLESQMPSDGLSSAMDASRRIPGAMTRRILVADDSPVNCIVAQRMLNGLGFSSEMVTSGNQALERHRKRPYDLILMDSQMAGMNGFEATTRIRAIQRHGSVPLIACTTASSDEQRNACLRAGMDDVCVKPLQPIPLRNLLLLWLPPHTVEEASRRDALTRAELLSLAGLFGAGFDDVVLTFRHDTELRLQALRQAAAGSDLQQLRKVAHALAGSCASIAGWHMAGLCRVLELKCQAGQRAGLTRLLAEIGKAYRGFNLQLDHVLRCQQLSQANEHSLPTRY